MLRRNMTSLPVSEGTLVPQLLNLNLSPKLRVESYFYTMLKKTNTVTDNKPHVVSNKLVALVNTHYPSWFPFPQLCCVFSCWVTNIHTLVQLPWQQSNFSFAEPVLIHFLRLSLSLCHCPGASLHLRLFQQWLRTSRRSVTSLLLFYSPCSCSLRGSRALGQFRLFCLSINQWTWCSHMSVSK